MRVWLIVCSRGAVLNGVSVAVKLVSVEFTSDRCCSEDNFCGIHLKNFVAFCFSIYGREKSDFKRLTENCFVVKLQTSHEISHRNRLENLTGDINATNIK